jgi:hypothetical protein
MGNPPFVSVYIDDAEQFSFSNFIVVIESNTVSSSVVTLWVQAPTNYEDYSFYELAVVPIANSANVTITYAASSNIWGLIDAGTQVLGVAGPSYGLPISLTGATAAMVRRPTSGSFLVGDFIIDQTGYVWICTTAGSPGTWTNPSSSLVTPVTIKTGADGNMGLIIEANSAIQSANLQEWQDYTATNLAAISSGGAYSSYQAAATSVSYRAAVTGASYSRLQIQTGGIIQWGNGTLVTDTNFGRVAAGGAALSITALTGATAASRYVGATASGAPTPGTFAVGDHVVDQTGTIWVCTAAGTLGTWVNVSSGSPLPNYATITTVRPGILNTGQYLTTANGGSTGTLATTSASLGVAYLVPIDIAKSGGFTGLSTNITVAAAGGTTVQVLMALYPDNGTGSGPFTSSSQISGSAIFFTPTSSGAADTSFSSALPLSVGRYWAAWCLTTAANPPTFPTVVSLTPLGNSVLDQLGNVPHKGVYVSISGSASSLPTTLSGLTIGFGSFPIMGLKAQ